MQQEARNPDAVPAGGLHHRQCPRPAGHAWRPPRKVLFSNPIGGRPALLRHPPARPLTAPTPPPASLGPSNALEAGEGGVDSFFLSYFPSEFIFGV